MHRTTCICFIYIYVYVCSTNYISCTIIFDILACTIIKVVKKKEGSYIHIYLHNIGRILHCWIKVYMYIVFVINRRRKKDVCGRKFNFIFVNNNIRPLMYLCIIYIYKLAFKSTTLGYIYHFSLTLIIKKEQESFR